MPSSRAPSSSRSSKLPASLPAAGQGRSAAGNGLQHRRADIPRGRQEAQEDRAWFAPSIPRRRSLAVAKVVDLARQAVLLVDRDALEDLDSLLELLDLTTQVLVFHLGLAVGTGVPEMIIGAPHSGSDDRRDHDYRDNDDC